jgi:hypothetical protein
VNYCNVCFQGIVQAVRKKGSIWVHLVPGPGHSAHRATPLSPLDVDVAIAELKQMARRR